MLCHRGVLYLILSYFPDFLLWLCGVVTLQKNRGLSQLDLLHNQVELGAINQRHLRVGVDPCVEAVVSRNANLESVMACFHRLLESQLVDETCL